MSRAINWCFTLNNYTIADVSNLEIFFIQSCSYMVFGFEVAASGTPHLQGFFRLKSRLRFQQIRSILGPIHLEPAKARNLNDAAEYCMKDGSYFEFGERNVLSSGQQGKRNDLDALQNDLQQRKKMQDIATQHFSNFIRYHRGIHEYRKIHAIKRDWQCSVIIYWGNTGTGKTRSVVENSTDLWVYGSDGWFDGYDQHKQVLFDDFSGSEFKINFLLKLLDRYEMQVKIKGGFVNWAPEEIYITSNLDPRDWYRNAHPQHVDALFRRFTNVVHFQ